MVLQSNLCTGGGRGVANCACILSWVYRRALGHTATNMRDQNRPLQPPITARQKQRILIHLGMATYQTNPYRDQGFTDRSGLAYCVSKRLQLAQMPPPTRIGLDFSMPAHSLICEKESGRHCKFCIQRYQQGGRFNHGPNWFHIAHRVGSCTCPSATRT